MTVKRDPPIRNCRVLSSRSVHRALDRQLRPRAHCGYKKSEMAPKLSRESTGCRGDGSHQHCYSVGAETQRPVIVREGEQLLLKGQAGWYKDAIIYQVHVRSFSDSNGDGIGDFQGLAQRLDYVQELGVTAIWVMPFYPSPLRDDGYDISDYRSVHPSYGTLEDFKAFLSGA